MHRGVPCTFNVGARLTLSRELTWTARRGTELLPGLARDTGPDKGGRACERASEPGRGVQGPGEGCRAQWPSATSRGCRAGGRESARLAVLCAMGHGLRVPVPPVGVQWALCKRPLSP